MSREKTLKRQMFLDETMKAEPDIPKEALHGARQEPGIWERLRPVRNYGSRAPSAFLAVLRMGTTACPRSTRAGTVKGLFWGVDGVQLLPFYLPATPIQGQAHKNLCPKLFRHRSSFECLHGIIYYVILLSLLSTKLTWKVLRLFLEREVLDVTGIYELALDLLVILCAVVCSVWAAVSILLSYFFCDVCHDKLLAKLL